MLCVYPDSSDSSRSSVLATSSEMGSYSDGALLPHKTKQYNQTLIIVSGHEASGYIYSKELEAYFIVIL